MSVEPIEVKFNDPSSNDGPLFKDFFVEFQHIPQGPGATLGQNSQKSGLATIRRISDFEARVTFYGRVLGQFIFFNLQGFWLSVALPTYGIVFMEGSTSARWG